MIRLPIKLLFKILLNHPKEEENWREEKLRGLSV